MIESKDGTADTIMQPKREYRPFTYPLWPISKPGPGATLPPLGQEPRSMRTDQMVYACYDQERGRPCVPPPTRVVRENSTRPRLLEVDRQEVESEGLELCTDNGG